MLRWSFYKESLIKLAMQFILAEESVNLILQDRALLIIALAKHLCGGSIASLPTSAMFDVERYFYT
jgi:hypothetical protein